MRCHRPAVRLDAAANEVAGMRAGSVEILAVDNAALRAFRGKSLIRTRGGRDTPGPDLTTMLQLVFGLR